MLTISLYLLRTQIKFHMEVLAGPSPKKVAAKAAKRLGATWVILDRSVTVNLLRGYSCAWFIAAIVILSYFKSFLLEIAYDEMLES